MLSVLFWLLVGHFVADYPLQTDFVAKHKSRRNSLAAVPWYYVLTGHAATHAAAVALATGLPTLGAVEFVAHWLIDWGKCEGRTGIHADQALHVACKLLWLALSQM